MRLLTAFVATAVLALGITTSAQAYTGRTTDKTYRTATSAAKATAAYSLTRYMHGQQIFKARGMKVVLAGRTPAGKTTSTWTLTTLKKTPFGYPIARVTVKVKKLGDHSWKGYTDGKSGVSLLKGIR